MSARLKPPPAKFTQVYSTTPPYGVGEGPISSGSYPTPTVFTGTSL